MLGKVWEAVKLLRIKHYIKNLLIFVPIFFGQKILEQDYFLKTAVGFISFCMISSAVYIVNDIKDVKKDRLHPIKCRRPIASGTVSMKTAFVWLVICIVLSIVFSAVADARFGFGVLLLYFLINIAYSYGLKDVPIADIVILASGFVLRIIYGSAVSKIQISSWLCLTVIAGAFYLGLGKRRNEMKLSLDALHGSTRKVLKYYSHEFLDKNMYVCLTLTETFYAFWTLSRGIELLIWTVPVIMIIMMRYSYDIEKKMEGDPVEVIFHDRFLVLIMLAYAAGLFFIFYT